MSRFTDEIVSLDQTKENCVYTVIDGPQTGEKLIVVDKKIIYESKPNIFNSEELTQLLAVEENRICKLDGKTVFCEIITSQKKLVICGGGHVSIPIIQIGKLLGFDVIVLEDRLSFANAAKKAGADHIICDNFVSGLHQVQGNKNTFFVIVTRGHRYDKLCLESILHKEHAYVGMIGSRLRVKKVMELLLEEGFSQEVLDTVHSPIGLRIHAETPTEIAISILAEVIMTKNERKNSEGYTRELRRTLADDALADLKKVLVTIVSRKGSAPREVGSKMLVMENGEIIGSIGGGCVEAEVRQQALYMMDGSQAAILHLDLTGKEAEEDGMVCGGLIDVFLERL